MKRPVFAWFAVLGLVAGSGAMGSGCSKSKKSTSACAKDTDCKGNRVCERGACVDPTVPQPPMGAMTPLANRPKTPPGAVAPGTMGPLAPGPGHGLTPPGAPAPGARSNLPPIKVCIGPKCMTVGPNFGRNPADMAQLFALARKLFMQGLGGGMGPQDKIQICIGKQCVKLDENLTRDPSALFRVLGQLAPGLFQQLFQGGGFPFGQRRRSRGIPGRPGRPGRPGTPSASPPPTPAPPAAGLLKDYASITSAGARAVGREAKLSGLTVTSVAADRLVLEGPGKEMIVLRVPANQRQAAARLRTATGKVTLRFRILSPPVGKILHGSLVAVK